MKITQPRVSDLVNGRIDKLINCLHHIGFRFKPVFADNKLTITVESVAG